MTSDEFFGHFLKELAQAEHLRTYYKFLNSNGNLHFRKSYFLRRLEYVQKHAGPSGGAVWDAGCGYGTTAIFLALNGYTVHGSTLEFYLEHLDQRLAYWSKIGDLSRLSIRHEDIFDPDMPPGEFDRIIVQDTLHHVEPIDEGIRTLFRRLRPDGKMIVVEENGRALILRAKLYLERGNKRTIMVYDERLKKEVLIGNENIRPFECWEELFRKEGLKVADREYLRCYPPPFWSASNYERLISAESALWHGSRLLRDYAFWGMNFVVTR